MGLFLMANDLKKVENPTTKRPRRTNATTTTRGKNSTSPVIIDNVKIPQHQQTKPKTVETELKTESKSIVSLSSESSQCSSIKSIPARVKTLTTTNNNPQSTTSIIQGEAITKSNLKIEPVIDYDVEESNSQSTTTQNNEADDDDDSSVHLVVDETSSGGGNGPSCVQQSQTSSSIQQSVEADVGETSNKATTVCITTESSTSPLSGGGIAGANTVNTVQDESSKLGNTLTTATITVATMNDESSGAVATITNDNSNSAAG